MIRLLRKLTPSFALGAYHYTLALLAHAWYGMPSRRMYVIGITGTKGKTTTCHLIAQLLEALGKNVGMTSSVQFRVGDERRVNDTKQGMPGRFRLQKLLREMVTNGCEYAVVETTSEGMLQYRHRFIDYNMAVFTNLSPEHIERHGGFEKYRDTKVGLFRKLARKKDGVGVYNLDDENVEYFLRPRIAKKIGFSLKGKGQTILKFEIQNIKLTDSGSEFDVQGSPSSFAKATEDTSTALREDIFHFEIPLVGEFNVYNAAAAVAAARSLGISLEKCAEALKNPTRVSGRFEVIQKEPFAVVVDYAHEPRSLEEAYRAASLLLNKGRLICLLGSQGGGRDTWKRAEMGKIAARYCDEIVLTNEDPYDEIPLSILNDIQGGISSELKVYKIIDRREAIKKAISFAKEGDVVVLTGKGGEVWMCVEGGKKIPWNEREIVQGVLNDLI